MEPSAIDGMRELWKLFDLNNSEGAGMKITYANGEVKQHGVVNNTDEGSSFTPVVAVGTIPCCGRDGSPVNPLGNKR